MEISVRKKPSAWLPVVMSLSAFALVAIQLITHGALAAHDQEAVAHLWQLLMAGEIPIILFFAWQWLPRAPRRAALVLTAQALAAAAALLPVYMLGW